MSVSVFFSFSMGFNRNLHCPKGTLAAIRAHIAEVEEILDLKVVPPGEGNIRAYGRSCGGHWDSFDPAYRAGWPDVEDELLCETIREHNEWVRWMYDRTAEWAKAEATPDGDTITPEIGATFWHALSMLEVPVNRWTGDYYRNRMEHLYEVMRGRESAGVKFDAKALTPEQASSVIRLFENFLDPDDLRLECPVGHDYLASSSDGGYTWCSKHGAIAEEDLDAHARLRCELGKELRDEHRDDRKRGRGAA